MSDKDFGDAASACAIDALSIICKRSIAGEDSFLEIKDEEVNNLYSIIKSGDATRNDLEDASGSNVLWCSIVLLLKPNSYFSGYDDINSLASKLPVHVQRFYGALFSTFEVLMNHQRNNYTYLVGSLIVCFGHDVVDIQNTIAQAIKDYKVLFAYAYIFIRRTGVKTIPQFDHVQMYFESSKEVVTAFVESDHSHLDLGDTDDHDDDNDSYEKLMRTNTGVHFSAPKFGAPLVMPLRPVKMLSDDEHYGSDYQPAIASDLETDLTYNSQRPVNRDTLAGEMQDDSMFSMDGGSILNSYYKYNGWNNAVEEDEDSDNDNYVPPVMEPTRHKRMTRMRQQTTSRSFDNLDGDGSKAKKTRKKRAKKLTKKVEATPPSSSDSKTKGPSWANAGLLSDDSDELDGDEESDYSESDAPAPLRPQIAQQQQHNIPSRKLTAAPSQSDEVEDFEIEEDFYEPSYKPAAYTPNTATKNASFGTPLVGGSSGHGGGRRSTSDGPHSPGSAGSSIELSDRERHRGKSSPPTRNNPIPRVSGRIRSVLSDDESEPDEGLPVSANHRQGGNLSKPRNPLDESIETVGFGTNAAKSAALVPSAQVHRSPHNPLDRSIDLSEDGTRSKSEGWAEASKPPSKVGANHSGTSARIPASSNRSVVRLPSASPSRPSTSGESARIAGNTEGRGADLVEDWDSQTSEDDEQVPKIGKGVHSVPVGVTAKKISPAVTETIHVAHPAPVSPPLVAAARAPAPTKSSPNPSAREIAMERLRENIRIKREKEIAAGTQPTLTRESPTLFADRRVTREDAGRSSRDPSPQLTSILRKSVTFEDQHSRSALSGSISHDKPAGGDSSPQFAPVAPLHRRPVNASAADMVLYGSRHSGNWDPRVGDQYPDTGSSESDVFFESPTGSPQPDRPGRQGGTFEDELEVPSLPPLGHHSKLGPMHSSVELPAARSTQAHASVHAPVPFSKPAPSSLVVVPAAHFAPTLSRVTSDQFMPVQKQAQELPKGVSQEPLQKQRQGQGQGQGQGQTEPVRESRITTSRQLPSSNVSVSSSITKPLLSLPGNFVPPPLSEFALNSGIIMEGYLNKKSGLLGIWQKRYFVLAESTTCFCVLRIFSRSVAAAWGPIAIGLKASIPIHSIEAVESVPTAVAKGKEFTIKFNQRVSKQSLSESSAHGHASEADNASDAGSEFSDSMFAVGGTKVTTLQAEDAETRLLWVTMLTKALAIAMDEC